MGRDAVFMDLFCSPLTNSMMQQNLIQNIESLLEEIDKLILKFIRKCRWPK